MSHTFFTPALYLPNKTPMKDLQSRTRAPRSCLRLPWPPSFPHLLRTASHLVLRHTTSVNNVLQFTDDKSRLPSWASWAWQRGGATKHVLGSANPLPGWNPIPTALRSLPAQRAQGGRPPKWAKFGIFSMSTLCITSAMPVVSSLSSMLQGPPRETKKPGMSP